MKTTSNNENRFRIIHNGVAPQKGYVLISEPFLDEIFQRSVIFMTDHDNKGSMGFVLNKPTDIILNNLFSQIKINQDIRIYLGGPVGNDKLFFLHTLGDILPNALHIHNNIYMNGNFDVLCNYINKGYQVEGKIKFFLGYAGWTSGQLDKEINDNTWLVSKINAEDIFCGEGENLWKKSLTLLDDSYKMWINYPKEPYLN